MNGLSTVLSESAAARWMNEAARFCRPGRHIWKQPVDVRTVENRIFVRLECTRCAFTTETSTPQGAKP